MRIKLPHLNFFRGKWKTDEPPPCRVIGHSQAWIYPRTAVLKCHSFGIFSIPYYNDLPWHLHSVKNDHIARQTMVAYLHNIPDLSLIVLVWRRTMGGKQISQVRAEIDTHDIHGCPGMWHSVVMLEKGWKTRGWFPGNNVQKIRITWFAVRVSICWGTSGDSANAGPLIRFTGDHDLNVRFTTSTHFRKESGPYGLLSFKKNCQRNWQVDMEKINAKEAIPDIIHQVHVFQ